MGTLFCLCTVILFINVFVWMKEHLFSSIPADVFSLESMARITSCKCIAGLALAAAHVLFCHLGPLNKEVRIYLDGLPSELEGFRIVQLSDLHIGPTRGRQFVEELVDGAIALRPNLVAITGDVIDGSAASYRAAAAPLGRLQATAPAVMVTGNHDHLHGDVDSILRLMADLGVRPLRNELLRVSAGPGGGGASLQVAGVDDASAGQWPGLASNASAALAEWNPRSGPVVVLAHQPRSAREVVGVWRGRRGPGRGGAVVLSGHTHCGQIFPFQLPAWLGNPYFCG
jgi:hypothetical protein